MRGSKILEAIEECWMKFGNLTDQEWSDVLYAVKQRRDLKNAMNLTNEPEQSWEKKISAPVSTDCENRLGPAW